MPRPDVSVLDEAFFCVLSKLMLDFITWNADPVLFSFGPIFVRWYGLAFSICFYEKAGAMTTSYNITKRRQSCSFVQWVFGDTWRRMTIGFALFLCVYS